MVFVAISLQMFHQGFTDVNPGCSMLYLPSRVVGSSLEDSDFLTQCFHVGSSQANPALDVTDVVVEVVQNAAVGGV